jgi:hypothetical protein
MLVEGADLPEECAILVRPDACAECPLNADNSRREVSPLLDHVFYLEQLQAAGAVFLYRDLTSFEWKALLFLKAERNRRELDRLKKR